MGVLKQARSRRTHAQPGVWEQRLDRVVLSLGSVSHGRDGSIRTAGVLRVIQVAERLAKRGHVEHLLRPGGIMRYELAPLPGKRVLPLKGQPPLHSGELVVVLHWDNRNVFGLAQSFSNKQTMTFQGSRVVREELRALADLARSGGLPEGVRAAWSEALIFPMLIRYGFTAREAPDTLRTPFVRLYLLGLLAIYSDDGLERARTGRHHLRLGEAWIGLDELKRRFPAS